jgi:hypothetical protein
VDVPAVTSSLRLYLAATPYGRLRCLLCECAVGTSLRVPNDHLKSTLEIVVRTWLAAVDQPPSRKRDETGKRQRQRRTAGAKLEHHLEQLGVQCRESSSAGSSLTTQ